MRIVLFSLFGYNVYSHGVFLVLAIALGGWLLYRFANKAGLNTGRFLSNYIVSTLLGIIAARAGFVITNLTFYLNYSETYKIWQGGLVSFAGFLVGGIVFWLLLKIQKQNSFLWLDIVGVVFPLAVAIGRIGCVLNGEVGLRYYGTFAYLHHFPVTAMEIYLCVAIFIINMLLYRYAKNQLPKYSLFLIFIVLYSLGRLFIDHWRADKMLAVGINLSQLTSFIIFMLAFFTFTVYYVKNRISFNGSGKNV